MSAWDPDDVLTLVLIVGLSVVSVVWLLVGAQ